MIDADGLPMAEVIMCAVSFSFPEIVPNMSCSFLTGTILHGIPNVTHGPIAAHGLRQASGGVGRVQLHDQQTRGPRRVTCEDTRVPWCASESATPIVALCCLPVATDMSRCSEVPLVRQSATVSYMSILGAPLCRRSGIDAWRNATDANNAANNGGYRRHCEQEPPVVVLRDVHNVGVVRADPQTGHVVRGE